jgi:hypothetical protein
MTKPCAAWTRCARRASATRACASSPPIASPTPSSRNCDERRAAARPKRRSNSPAPSRSAATACAPGGLTPDDLVEAGMREYFLDQPLPASLGLLERMADPGLDRDALAHAFALDDPTARQVIRTAARRSAPRQRQRAGPHPPRTRAPPRRHPPDRGRVARAEGLHQRRAEAATDRRNMAAALGITQLVVPTTRRAERFD